ncbi:hypothetical protein SPRG_03163 [Saprolegnia parasitica CBS 223.65]|uniref:Cyclic nucleotide-binding domain-containing protein n=1 Tax=Saprolegnia parasitica (strain CBS 223.65) TaxID=695850 RepID=A0A067CYR2_SAPPC|nr:hypothetical protein SPRG_03163 [Saprolegnia parasitica CBS 223.65]KDO31947.1 hypothetical protein SPRG_03163 [Saprolegnia parasitica CBS 223.65]|eukprot:XP_012197145.1 hypothetical protein SPRG_03163 [Saprolegnia parasitica CBS 223.65]
MGRRRTVVAPEGKRTSLVYSKPIVVAPVVAPKAPVAELDMSERKRLLVANVPILTMAIAAGASRTQLMDALTPLHFPNGAFIVRQGETDSDIYFVESGTIQITRARLKKLNKDDQQQISTRTEFEYFGESTFAYALAMQRTANAIAVGDVKCFTVSLHHCNMHLGSVRDLMRYRLLMRENGVLDNLNVFSALTLTQRGRMLGLSTLRAYDDGAHVCKLGEIDDQYFVLVEGEAKVCIRPNGVEVELLRKVSFQGFGEMGLFGKPRTADVVAVGPIVCIVMNRESFVKAQTGAAHDADGGALATNVSNEWSMLRRLEAMHSNPRVVEHLVKFVRKFQSVQAQKFAGKTMYTDLYRRVFANPRLALGFPSISNRIDWFDPISARKVIRFETKRILSTEPSRDRPPDDVAFLGRLAETSTLLEKFRTDDSKRDGKFLMASQLARLMEFAIVRRGKYIFKQNTIEGKAYMVLRGDVSVVFEDGDDSVGHVVATLTGGDSFGELTLVTNMPRSASAVAATDVELIVLQRRHFARLLPGFRIRHYIIERADYLHELYPKADHKACIRVAFDMAEATYHAEHIFLRHGHHARGFYLILTGVVGVYKPAVAESRGVVHVGSLGPRQFFGASVFAIHDVEGATYMATTTVTVLELSDAKARRMDLHMIQATTAALKVRATYEASVVATTTPALLFDPISPWAFLGDEKTQLQHQVDNVLDAFRTQSGGALRGEGATKQQKCENGELRSPRLTVDASPWTEPVFPLPAKDSKPLLGSFLSRKLQSYQRVTAIVPAKTALLAPLQPPIEVTPTSLAATPRQTKHHHRRVSGPWPNAAGKAASAPEPEVDDTEADDDDYVIDWTTDDCSDVWRFDRVHDDNLYL